MDAVLEYALETDAPSGVDLPGERLTDLEYADDIVLLSDEASKLQRLLDRLTVSAGLFGMCFAPRKCKFLVQYWMDPAPNLTLKGELFEKSSHKVLFMWFS